MHCPSKRLGQNFLNDSRIIDRIIQALAPKSDETIIEIGPGRGALTAQLVESAGALVAVEFDKNLIRRAVGKIRFKPELQTSSKRCAHHRFLL